MTLEEWKRLGLTSGRRTYKGNKLVGGVSNSEHLRGTAADFTAPLSVLRGRFPNARILDEGDHRHVAGLEDVPYYGNRGTAGLVNGVDTTAPKGQPMLQPRKPNYAPLVRPQGGMEQYDPIQDAPLGFMSAQQPDMQMPPLASLPDPQIAKPKGKGGKTFGTILGVLGDALAAYGGQRGVFAPMMQQQMQEQAEENRFARGLDAQREMYQWKAALQAQMPQKPTQTDRYVQEVLDPNTHPARRQLLMQILTKPLVSMGADGSQTTQYGIPEQSGEDEWEYDN